MLGAGSHQDIWRRVKEGRFGEEFRRQQAHSGVRSYLGRAASNLLCESSPVLSPSRIIAVRAAPVASGNDNDPRQPIARPKVWPGTPIASSSLRATRPSFATE